MEEKNNSSMVVLWSIGCVAIGALIGVVFAPKAGSETRDDVLEFGKQSGEKSRKLLAKLKGMIPLRMKAAAVIGAAKGVGKKVYDEAESAANSMVG